MNIALRKLQQTTINALCRREEQRRGEAIEADRIASEMRAKGYAPSWDAFGKNVVFDKIGRAWRFMAFVGAV